MVNTKQAQRRDLKFNSIDDLSAELDRIQHAHDAGTLSTTGNWSPGQNLQHLAIVWKAGIDGFPPEMKPPFFIKWPARWLFKKRATAGETAPAGIKLPKQASKIIPVAQVAFDQGMHQLREQIARTTGGERFAAHSPIFGDMTHEQWTNLQLGHCQLHLGFLQPG